LPALHFEIVGASVLAGRAQDHAIAPPNVTFHGWLSRPATVALLNGVDALVMPSRWDAAPIVAIEAMRAGVPVIASNRGGLPEIVGDGVGGLVFDVDDPDALGRVLQRLRHDELEFLGIGARERWERYYVADPMNELTCDAYDRVVSREKRRWSVRTAAPARSDTPAFEPELKQGELA
jgi:glycosyltransferase involved in cell wall biosynthesis